VLLHDPQTASFEILRGPVNFFRRRAVPLEELFLRKINALVRRGILPMLKIGHPGLSGFCRTTTATVMG
jgi:hypothetical protein